MYCKHLYLLMFVFGISFSLFGCSISNDPNIVDKKQENFTLSNKQLNGEIKFEVDKKTYKRGQYVKLTILNNSNYDISFGQHFMLQTFENNYWYTLTLEMAFTLEELGLKPNESFDQTMKIFNSLPRGKYRFVKHIQIESQSEYIISEEFYVNGSL